MGDDLLFVASGPTSGDFLDGVRPNGDAVSTDTMVIIGARGTVQRIHTEKPLTD